MSTFRGIVLPIRLQNLFSKVALKEGFLNIEKDYEFFLQDDKSQEMPGEAFEVEKKQARITAACLERRINPYQKQKVFESLLLFGKAFITENMFFNYGPLLEEGLVDFVALDDYDTFSFFDTQRAKFIKPIFEAMEYSNTRNKYNFLIKELNPQLCWGEWQKLC